MNPGTSIGVIAQTAWRGVGDIDDCSVCADLMAVHAVAPWSVLASTPAYREAAGNPDDPTQGDGLTIGESEKALRALYPRLAIERHDYVSGGITGAQVAALILNRQTAASVSVLAGKLPSHGTYLGQHRVAIVGQAGNVLKIGNPLKAAYSSWPTITPAELAAAIDPYPRGVGGGVILFPTPAEAFVTHPLYVSPGAAEAQGYQKAKAAAIEAVEGI